MKQKTVKKLLKKLVTIGLIACMGLSVVGCSDKDDNAASGNNSGKEDTRTTNEILSELDLSEYVELGKYKGLEIEKTVAVVTDKEVDTEIGYALSKYPVEITDRTDVQKGDTANIDFVGRMDGEVFEGGSSEGFDLVIGSKRFIDGFEDKLIGVKVGETVVLDLKFPDPYQNNPDVAGKDVEFTVTVNSISAPLDAPTDEWVKKYIEGYSTAEEYRKIIRTMLEEANALAADDQLMYNAWTKVIEGSTVHKYPDVLVERGASLYKADIESYAEYMGMSVEDYVKSCDVTMEEYEKYAIEYGQTIAAQSMVNYAICEAEGFKLEDDGYKAELKELLEEYECTEEELKSKYDRDNIEQTVMLNRVCDLIIDEATVTEVKSSETEE